MPLSEGEGSGYSCISWISSLNDKENKNEKIDHIPNPVIKMKGKMKKGAIVTTTAIKEVAYDVENHCKKQIERLTEWINETYKPEGQIDSEVDDDGLKVLLHKKREAVQRHQCFQLYRSEEMIATLKSLEKEVSDGRLSMREDRDILADLGLQEDLFALIFSYEMPYIRLGLEIVFGEIISLSSITTKNGGLTGSSNGAWKNAIKNFVLEKMLNNATITAQYTKQQLHCVSYGKI